MSRCKTGCGKWAFNDGFCRNCAKQADVLAKTPPRVDLKAPVSRNPAAPSFQLEPHLEETAVPTTGQLERALAAFVVDSSDHTVTASELELVTQRGLQLYEEELQASRETLGDRHPDTLASIDSMATLLKGIGKPEEARLLLEEALRARRETLGDRHPDTLTTVTSMATLLVAMRQPERARPLFEEELEASRETLGDRHADTLVSISNLGQLLQAMGQLEEARSLYEEALQGSRETLGDHHPDTLALLDSMGTLHEG